MRGRPRIGGTFRGTSKIARLVTGALVALALACAGLYAVGGLSTTLMKITGRAGHCSWTRTIFSERDQSRMAEIGTGVEGRVRLTARDEARGLEKYETVARPFWIKKQGNALSGGALLKYLLTEHLWMAEVNPEDSVRQGDIVFDCGAHVGTFTDQALARGAARVIAIEPEPLNAWCLRQNFAAEIAKGTVVVLEKGVWSIPGSMDLEVSTQNSGMNSMVGAGSTNTVRVPVTTIDTIVRELGLPRVDYIKMDIEGAEREALKGGIEAIRRWRPRMMLEIYHRPDDVVVLPGILLSANPGYERSCGPCSLDTDDQVKPHVVYYR